MSKPEAPEGDLITEPRAEPIPRIKRLVVALPFFVAACGILWLTIKFAPMVDHPSASGNIHSEAGNLKVDYVIQTTPNTASGSTIDGVTDIEFYPGYVVVKRKDGSGSVFFNERTQSLYWKR